MESCSEVSQWAVFGAVFAAYLLGYLTASPTIEEIQEEN